MRQGVPQSSALPRRSVKFVTLTNNRGMLCGSKVLARPWLAAIKCRSCTCELDKIVNRQTTTSRQSTQTLVEQPCSTAVCTNFPETPSTARHTIARSALHGTAIVAVAAAMQMFLPEVSHSAETLPTDFVQLWLDKIEAAGPLGPVIFILTVICAEMVPLLPTQPLMLAGGLLFGAQQGGLYVWLGTLVAGVCAFTVSRGVGSGFAQSVISKEMGEAEESGVVTSQLKKVYDTIDSGNGWSQYTAIALLRLTPVVPFSATNYLLGLTPLPLLPFVAGSATGMGVWSFVYASVGGASRSLLLSGTDMESLFADMAERAGRYTHDVGVVGLVLGVVAAVGISQGWFKLTESDVRTAAVENKNVVSIKKEASNEKELETINDRV